MFAILMCCFKKYYKVTRDEHRMPDSVSARFFSEYTEYFWSNFILGISIIPNGLFFDS
jgi:hypothetical protein